jgi:uncharacterized protein
MSNRLYTESQQLELKGIEMNVSKICRFSWLQFLLKSGGVILSLYIISCLFLFFFQRWLIFSPSSKESEITPATYNLKYEEVWIPVTNIDGKTKGTEWIHGWWIPSAQLGAKVFLHFHGAGANIGFNAKFARELHRADGSVLLIDYRGYGKSKGNHPSETSVYADGEAAWNYLTSTKQIRADQIIIFGHSLGGAIAIDLASKHPEAAGLIVESSFSSLKELLSQYGLGIFLLDLIQNQKFESIAKVPFLKIPVLFLHGDGDRQIPSFMSQRLYDAAPNPKKLVMLTGVGHDNLIDSDQYHAVILEFLQQVDK